MFLDASLENSIAGKRIVAGQPDNVVELKPLCHETEPLEDVCLAAAHITDVMLPAECLDLVIQRIFGGRNDDFSTKIELLQ